MKGDITPYSLFIIIVIGMILFVAIIVTYHWLQNILPAQGNQFTCTAKITNYCLLWLRKDKLLRDENRPYVYSDRNPKNCEQLLNIRDSGPSSDDCRKALNINQ